MEHSQATAARPLSDGRAGVLGHGIRQCVQGASSSQPLTWLLAYANAK